MQTITRKRLIARGIVLALVASGCAPTQGNPDSMLKTGGMTSGGWGRTYYERIASCDVDVTVAAAADDGSITRGAFVKAWIGAATSSAWYELRLGTQNSPTDYLVVSNSFNTDGDIMSLGYMDSESDPNTLVGTVTVTKNGAEEASQGTVEWTRLGRQGTTKANLSCTKPGVVQSEPPIRLAKKLRCRETENGAPVLDGGVSANATLESGNKYSVEIIQHDQFSGDTVLGLFRNIAPMFPNANPLNFDIRRPSIVLNYSEANEQAYAVLSLWESNDPRAIRARLNFKNDASSAQRTLAMSCAGEF